MRKKDETVAQLEAILKELKTANDESAATAVVGQRSGNRNTSGTLTKLLFRVLGARILLVAVLLIAAVSVGSVWLLSGSTFKKETTVFVEDIKELATLATAEASVKTVIKQEDNKLFGNDLPIKVPGTKREILLIVPGTVIAGVDLKAITEDDIKVNEKEKVLDIVLPHAELIQDPTIQMEKLITFSDEGIFRGEVKWDEGFDLAAEAQETIRKEAIEGGLLVKAEKSAEKVLVGFFDNLGYTVNVTFK
ncbi:DUF4230 domain-containing protein [Fredinandcohnia onubensis]|uniref:DUF4230 domain-containing protein n=1 Tax=Fredinandcohnia onubensis TaxID=1571209 RepID=UPI000C0BF653|nr:DUF4230 domain-containing protein [Fredinandcohnia onubensis]